MWLGALFGLTILCLVQGESGDSSDLSASSSLESLLEDVGKIKEEVEDDLERFRNNRALYSARISGDSNPKNDVYPPNRLISAFADTLDYVHETAAKLIGNRIKRLEKCVRSIGRAKNREREKRRQKCQALAKLYQEECQEVLIKRNSDLHEESKVFLETHSKELDKKNAEMIRDIKVVLVQIDIGIVTRFSKRMKDFEDSLKEPLPWKVRVDCLEEASTIKKNMTAEKTIFSDQTIKEVNNCQLRSATNSTLRECLWETKDKVDQKLVEIKHAADINFEVPFMKAKECAQNFWNAKNAPKEDEKSEVEGNDWMSNLFSWL